MASHALSCSWLPTKSPGLACFACLAAVVPHFHQGTPQRNPSQVELSKLLLFPSSPSTIRPRAALAHRTHQIGPIYLMLNWRSPDTRLRWFLYFKRRSAVGPHKFQYKAAVSGGRPLLGESAHEYCRHYTASCAKCVLVLDPLPALHSSDPSYSPHKPAVWILSWTPKGVPCRAPL